MTRDRYLPSPEVCDWLLAQTWSEPATVHVNGPESTGWCDDCCRATAALGRDECIDLVLPAEGIEMLREDQRRRAEAIDSSADPQAALTERILTEAKQSNLTVSQAADAMYAAAQSLISRACAATYQDIQP